MPAAELLAAAVPVAVSWAASAFWAAFWALRLTVYAILVCAAWIRIIEADAPGHHTAHRAPRHPPPPSPARSEVSDSIADWSIWDAESELGDVESMEGSEEADAPEAPRARPATAVAAAPATPVTTVVARALPRPPVSASAVPTPPAQQQSSLADEVLPDEVAELAEDHEEKQALAEATVAGDAMAGAAVAAEGGHHGHHGRHGKHKKAKKPWLNRKLEGFFKPYSEKTHAAGIMIYKGLGRMGKQIERGTGTLSKRLDGAIRDAGAEAALEIELLVQKWVKFAGVVAFLTVALMPLPSVHVTLSMGQPAGATA
ncbi:hypothetical protein ABPG75_007640 [Micractinium tetrahymenae]